MGFQIVGAKLRFVILSFAQFAMGLNMPAKTVVFTAVKKWDGDSHRFIGSGEYIQVSEDTEPSCLFSGLLGFQGI